MLILGITGNIGSGKSTACEILKGMKGYIINADELSHEVILRGKPAFDEILAEVDSNILADDGEIDRKRLGAIVFSDAEKLKKLTRIVHKYVIEETRGKIGLIKRNPGEYKFITIDGPLLFEAGMEKLCHYTILVSASEKTRLERVVKRDGLTFDDARKRSRSRKDTDEYSDAVDFIITNDRDFETLNEQVKRCVESLI